MKLEKMNIIDILLKTGISLTYSDLVEIFINSKEPKISMFNTEGTSAMDELESPEVMYEFFNKGSNATMHFLLKHQDEINKVRLVVVLFNRANQIITNGCSENEKKEFELKIKEMKKLLEGIDKIVVLRNYSEEELRQGDLTIVRTKEIVTGRSTVKKDNEERLSRISDEDFFKIIKLIRLDDLQNIICSDYEVGTEIRYMIVENTLNNQVKENQNELEKLWETEGHIAVYYKTEIGNRYADEAVRMLKKHIQEVEFDNLLMCASINAISKIENGEDKDRDMSEEYSLFKSIKSHLRNNSKMVLYDDRKQKIKFKMQDLDLIINHFIDIGSKIKYLSMQKHKEIITKLNTGEILLSDLIEEVLTLEELKDIEENNPELLKQINLKILKSLEFREEHIADIVRTNTDNYIFILQETKYKCNKNDILQAILETKKCSLNLLKVLCEKTDITPEDICNLFEQGIISIEDLKVIREQFGTIISDEKLFEKYMAYKNCNKEQNGEKVEEARTEFEKYALAYRTTEVMPLENQESQEEKAMNFVEKFMDQIDDDDLIKLYRFDIIPFKTAIIGGNNIAIELIKNEALKKADIICLREEGILTEEFIQNLFERDCPDMSYAYQLLIMYNAFNINSEEGKKSINNLQQFLHIEEGIIGKNKTTQNTSRVINPNPKPTKIEMGRDPGAKMNLLTALDKDVRIEDGIIDGHMIFHFPNLKGGSVVIEKLHNINKNRKTRNIQINADNESATYIMSEQEFIELRGALVQDGKIDRTQLTQRWWNRSIPGNPDPKHWMPHVGLAGWELALIDYFEINENNPRISEEHLEEIKSLMIESIASKKTDYTPEDINKINQIIEKRMKSKQEDGR